MRVNCLHGYFIFQESNSGQISQFSSLTGAKIVKKDDYYTFKDLEEAPEYSLPAKPYLGLPAIKAHEGKPWEVLEANAFVYNFQLGTLVPIMSVIQKVTLSQAGGYWVSNGLILPGSLTDEGKRVKGYAAWYSTQRLTFHYSRIDYV